MASNGSKVKPPAVPLFFLRVGAAVSMPVLVACERFHAFLQCMLSSGILLKDICVFCRLSAQRSCKCCSGTTTMTCSLCWLVCASCACVPARKQTSDHVPPAFAVSLYINIYIDIYIYIYDKRSRAACVRSVVCTSCARTLRN